MLPPLRIAVATNAMDAKLQASVALAEVAFDGNAGEVDHLRPRWREANLGMPASRWRADSFDMLAFDNDVWRCIERHGRCEIIVEHDQESERALGEVVWQVATRFQRFGSAKNRASDSMFFRRVLNLHDRLFDRQRPLSAADHEHALDTWRWTLRLDPEADAPLQLGALFHDIERLVSEADRRIEQLVEDYGAFKATHALRGSHMVRDLLGSLDAPLPLTLRTQYLVARHEVQAEEAATDRETELLTAADALSFFSLNAPGFLRYFGPEHTAKKVNHALGRLNARARGWLPRLRMPPVVRALVEAAIPLTAVPSASASPPKRGRQGPARSW